MNISPTVLSPSQIELLCKGLSFCPTPEAKDYDFNDDLYEFTRKLRLKYHFRNNNNRDTSIVKPPSTFLPPKDQDTELEKIIHQLKHLQLRKNTKTNNNMTKSLQEAHRTLVEKVENMEIVVKSAGKGEVTVIMSTNYYYEMCMDELNKEKV